MSEAFDAYHEWLGIPPREQPPTAYRLLGIDLFEGNPNVIANAAERQIVYVRSRQLGRHQQAAQGLLNEISSARVLLLDPRRKAEYDAGLAAARQGAIAPPVAAPAVAAIPAAAAPPVVKPTAFVPSPAGPPSALVWGLAAAGGLFAAGVGLLAWHSSTTPPSPKNVPAASHERPEEPSKPAGPVGVLPAPAPVEDEPDPVPDKKKPARPGKKPKKGKNRDVDLEVDSVTSDKALPPPKGEKELEAGLGGLADSLLDKMSKPPAATPKPVPPKAVPPAPLPAVTDAADAAKMSYAAEPMANGGIRVTIHDTPLGTATMLLDGDFAPGSTHNFTRRVPPDAAPADQHTLEVDVVGGKVTRVVWDKHEVKRKP